MAVISYQSQRISDFVGDSRGKLADCCHLVVLKRLPVHRPHVGHIVEHEQNPL
ncbi:hypothetical protein SDC9_206239 [bioreactor metagenome]|uniref:Uncharacterized protein n=1 Tax=bioreactor metagenome TaxID=1076179 RepID=A0A645JDP8_9ZZZZ